MRKHKKADLIYSLWLRWIGTYRMSCTIRSSQSNWASASPDFTLPESNKETRSSAAILQGAQHAQTALPREVKKHMYVSNSQSHLAVTRCYLAGFTPPRGVIVWGTYIGSWKIKGIKSFTGLTKWTRRLWANDVFLLSLRAGVCLQVSLCVCVACWLSECTRENEVYRDNYAKGVKTCLNDTKSALCSSNPPSTICQFA